MFGPIPWVVMAELSSELGRATRLSSSAARVGRLWYHLRADDIVCSGRADSRTRNLTR